MGMTYSEILRTIIDDMNSNGRVSQEQLNTLLLTIIANSLVIIADALTDPCSHCNRCYPDRYKAESEE